MSALICGAFLLAPCDPMPTGDITSGWWSQYAEPISRMQAAYHGYPEFGYYVALPDCIMVGQWVQIQVEDGEWMIARVFDCLGANGDPSKWGEGKWIGELNYYLAERFGVIGRGAKGKVMQ